MVGIVATQRYLGAEYKAIWEIDLRHGIYPHLQIQATLILLLIRTPLLKSKVSWGDRGIVSLYRRWWLEKK